ncbi:spatacsin isoform X2 [Chaetodon auriga]|uniref:spatacsin isoform X2 n=1 Tax=Chaetodon auriga TaxID=39042 RepID=UPI0040328E8B
MLDAAQRPDETSTEVLVIPENQHGGEVADIQKAELAPGGSLLGCLEVRGRLVVWDPADREAPPAAADGWFTDFSWEDVTVHSRGTGSFRLLAVGAQSDLKLLEVEAERPASMSLHSVCECPADRVLQTIREQDHSVCELQAVRVLSFAAGRCCLLLNCDWLLQLQWQQTEEELQTLSCFNIQLTDRDGQTAVHHCVCRETLFVLSSAGLVTVYQVSDGSPLASVRLPAYLSSGLPGDDLVSSSSFSSSSPFCLLQVSADLSTAVAVAQSGAAVAVDLDHYFRTYPDHLLCAAPPPRPPLRPQHLRDQDGLWSSGSSLSSLGSTFSADRSWEARLASMYSRAQQAAAPSSSSSSSSWSSSLLHLQTHQAPSSGHSRVPHGGATVALSVPESSSPSLLAVSEFSAQLTFVSPGNRQTTMALWDFESGSVSYHRSEGEAAPVQRCGERQHRLLLKKAGVFQVLFSVSQQDLLSRLMLFGSAATVDAVCHLNNWGRCSIPIHALQAGLKNRQLDTVDFYLKSKENVLNAAADQPEGSRLTDSVQELCPALDLLCSAVRESNSEAQSRQFSEQLLNVTMTFISTQTRSVLSNTHHEDADVRSCVDVLDRYVTELRSYMKRFPWPAGGDTSSTSPADPAQEDAQGDEWEQLLTEEVVRRSILTNEIPRAQAVLRRRSRPEQRLSALRMEGLRQAFACLQRRDLQTANTLLTNMGFSVKKQLHSICLYTDDNDLREFVVEELSGQSYFPEEEMQSVAFMREMEKLGRLPASRRPADATSHRVVQMGCKAAGGGEEVLEELVRQRRSEEDGGLWRNLRLDWVRNWDQSCQTAVLLSRLQHTELSSCDPAVLWRYLTALHDRRRVVDWIDWNKETSSASRWPELTPELVNNNTVCSTYMREDILDQLARRRLFIPEELADLEQLLWRLAQGGGVMASSPPVLQYRSPLGFDLHSLFVAFCLDHSLQYLLYTYLEHFRLTPRNCPLLTNQSLSESQPWFEMLVKIQEITRDLSDPGLVFQASLTSAQVLLPGSQASLSSLLLEGHSLLVLAAVMFAPGGIDQVVVQGERSGRSERTVDPQLLKMALAPHPKLRAALFPAGPRGSSSSSDVSVYHLLQSLHPLDPSRLFSWQAANTLNSTETSELPHFSSPHLVNRFALVENLDFLYYLRHGRPSFAYATFLVQQLSGCSDVTLLLQHTWQQVYRLTLKCFSVPSVVSASVCFCELLGVCSLKLRVDVRAMTSVLQHWNQHNTHSAAAQQLHTLGVKLAEAEAEPGAAEQLIGHLEAAVTDSLEQRAISRSSYEAAQEWALPVQFCQLHSLKLSSVYPAHCADDGQFIHFLLFVQLHNFPPQQVRSLAAQFGPALQAHLTLAFQDLQVCSQRRRRGSAERSGSLRAEEAPGSPEHPTELFQVLLQSQEEAAPCRYLLQEALVQRCPTLAVMAACQQEAELLPCLCVWVLTSVDDVTAGEAASHLVEAPQHHEWSLHDLSIIWRTLLGRGHVRPLLRGFELFQRDCPLVLVLRMFELCCDYRNFSEAKDKLLDFQRTLVSQRSGGPAPSSGLPLQWVESQASVLLLTMLQRCSSQYDLHRLLQLLADVDKLLKSNGPDFRKLSQLSQLLQGSEVSLSPRLLRCTSPSVQQEEFQAAVDALQSRGRYSQARQVAQLAGLSVHHLLLSQLLQEVNSQKSKRQWGRLETRVSFWRKCHEQLKADGTDPESASRFFLSQAESGTADSSGTPEPQTELLAVRDRCLLLCLAAHWLSRLSPAPVDRLESLEKKLWISRVRQRVLTASMEKDSVFNLPPPAITPEMNTYEVLMKEFSFSSISGLNTEERLRLEGLPGPSEEQEELNVDPVLSPEERSILAALIGQLLDEGSIHEASRVCRYFCLHHPDMWVVLRCRGLASGELNPEAGEEASEGLPAASIKSSPSVSSLLSFVMLPLPEDEVAVQLQRLVDQCRHGSNYCKQVLSLYQLSKELQCSFGQVCREDPRSVLEKLLLSEQPERFRKAQAFIRAQGLSADSVAELVSSAVVQALLASTQELPPEKQVFRPAEGRDSLVQLIKLCDDPNLVGVKLLEDINRVSLRDLSCIVELLIVAHDCFSLTCNMEGIVRVLQAARHLSHAYLAPGEHYSLLVRLLTGIGRYNEMTYVFDLLHQNHRFEMLLRKKVETDRGQSSSLKTALLDYIKRCLPADSEKHNMVALCFSMRREIGENHEMAARTQLKIIESQAWAVGPDLKSSLLKVLNLLKDAAESFSKDSCVRQASRCVRSAKLVALQLHFLNQGSDLRVINLRPAELLNAVTSLPRCFQVFVVSEAYSYSPDWAEILFQKVILNGDFVYLEELRRHRPLTSSLFEDIFKKLDGTSAAVAPNVKRLLTYCDDVYSRYRLAYQQNLYDVTKSLLQDAKTSSYLNDRLSS